MPTDAIVEADGKFYIFIVTNKEPEEHHEEGEEGQDHSEAEKGRNQFIGSAKPSVFAKCLSKFKNIIKHKR